MTKLRWLQLALGVCALVYCAAGVKVWRWSLMGQSPAKTAWWWLLLVVPFWPAVAGYMMGFSRGLSAQIRRRR